MKIDQMPTMNYDGFLKKDDLIFAPPTEQYTKGHLEKETLEALPENQFNKWFKEAKASKVPLPESVTLATAELPSGRVSSRIVLMKELDRHGNMIIYSNWGTSKKSKDIKSNPHASLTFFWKEMERQVRVEGTTEFISNEESQIYFDTRPRDSKIGAWASPQSSIVKNRHELDAKVTVEEQRFDEVEQIPCPPYWGGMKIIPYEWEFFQGRKGRLHDRLIYSKKGEDQWEVHRLAP
ncbi:pyridoxamine 5'-phosphate oxidase [Trichomonascus vanleenenianus]|uniref:pyridoxamine-phosphate oxidase PDX3 n=1 Tax=Trichomonascus vanleenenianus TaxID=2268995 RepID=UPI003ECA13C2